MLAYVFCRIPVYSNCDYGGASHLSIEALGVYYDGDEPVQYLLWDAVRSRNYVLRHSKARKGKCGF